MRRFCEKWFNVSLMRANANYVRNFGLLLR